MTEYLKYYLAPLTQALALWGLMMGGDYVWIGVAWVVRGRAKAADRGPALADA